MSTTLPLAVNADDWQTGPADAPVTLVEYGDFQCGDCREAYFVLKQLREEQGEKLRLVYRHLPLTDVHPFALAAAKASEAAGRMGQFWPIWAALYELPSGLTLEEIAACATQAGLEPEAFQREWNAPESYHAVRTDVDGIRKTGLGHAPILWINGELFAQPVTYAGLTDALRRLTE